MFVGMLFYESSVFLLIFFTQQNETVNSKNESNQEPVVSFFRFIFRAFYLSPIKKRLAKYQQ